ncbi:hypothetical protein [Tenacibaculum agarivorans]|uniref:hypothetical protein n=1 Tax=Tenacibaculum agarivorans TaxID=1908389 RepID=UPI000AF46914|nr:hypothetical protein [Tenacibaculum agarivorans]
MLESIIVILIGFAVIAIFDIIGSILSRILDFEYVWFAFGSFIIYGFIALYLQLYGSFVSAIIGSFIVGAFDSTVGLYIAKIFKAKILESDKEIIKITPKLIVHMGTLASIIGALTIVVFK